MSHQTAPTPHKQAALLPSYGSITFAHLIENSSMDKITIPMFKSKGKTCMVEEPPHVKQLSLNQVCKIGLIEI
jgi:hypothetical protein